MKITMVNILSIQNGQWITGKEINDWCRIQIEGNTSHAKEAARLMKKRYRDDAVYVAAHDDKHQRIFMRLPGVKIE